MNTTADQIEAIADEFAQEVVIVGHATRRLRQQLQAAFALGGTREDLDAEDLADYAEDLTDIARIVNSRRRCEWPISGHLSLPTTHRPYLRELPAST